MALEHSTCITYNANPSEFFQSKVHTPPEMQMLREWSTCRYALGEASCVFLGISRSLEQCESCQQTTETLTEAPCSAGPRASCRAYRLILPPSPPQRRCLMSPANPWRPWWRDVAWVRNGGIGGYYGILQVPGTKIHQDSPGEVLCTKSIQIPSLSNMFKPNHPSFGVAECCHSSPECGGRGGVDCCMKTAPKRTRETSQRRSGDNTCRDIDVEVLCGPAGFHMFNCSNHLLQNTPVSRVVK